MNIGAIVTGGSLRIGESISKILAKLGYSVVIHCNNSSAQAHDLAKNISLDGGVAAVIQCDLRNKLALASLIENSAILIQQPIGVLINNASIYEPDDVDNFSHELFAQHMDVNACAPIILSGALSRHLASNKIIGAGSIVNILDYKLGAPNADHLSYTVSKYALFGLTEILSRSMAPSIRVNAVSPGVTLANPTFTTLDCISAKVQSPLGYGPEPSDIADAVAYLVSAKCVTGQTIYVDSGERFLQRSKDFMS